MKAVMLIAFVGILAALASAGVFMLRRGRARAERDDAPDAAPDRHMARALAVRVGISVALFLFVLLSWAMGWVRPGGLPVGG
jgi:hypothetical protein